jgi:hypothetical protein
MMAKSRKRPANREISSIEKDRGINSGREVSENGRLEVFPLPHIFHIHTLSSSISSIPLKKEWHVSSVSLLHPDSIWRNNSMPVKHPASKHHMDAADRHHEAAKNHHAAATHHEAGDHDKAKEHSKKAREHGDAAVEHGKKGHDESHK